MAEITGVVEGISTKYAGKLALKVVGDPNWYSTKVEWLNVRPDKGDKISFDNGNPGEKFLKKVQILEKGAGSPADAPSEKFAPVARKGFGSFPIAPLDGQRSIIRQNSLGHAVASLTASGVLKGLKEEDLTSTVINVARIFESYSAGDIEREEAENQLNNVTDA